jgi:hypothetical protein
MTGFPVRTDQRVVAQISRLNKTVKQLANLASNPTEVGGVLNRNVLQGATQLAFWSFEGSTDSWVGTNATLSSSPLFATDGNDCLLLTVNSTSGSWYALSPPTAINPTVYSAVNVSMDVYNPGLGPDANLNLNAVTAFIAFYYGTLGSGTLIETVATTPEVLSPTANDSPTLSNVPVPSNATYYVIGIEDGEVSGIGTGLCVDNVAVDSSATSWQLNGDGTAVVPAAYLTGQVAGSVIGNIGVLNSNPYFAAGDDTGWTAYQGTFTVTNAPPAGSPFGFAAYYVNNNVTLGALEESGLPFAVVAGQQYLVTAWVYSSVASVALGFDWQNPEGTYLSTNTSNVTVTPSTWTQINSVQTAAAGATWAYPRVGPNTLGASIYAEAVLCFPQVPGTLVEAGTITGTQIATGILLAAVGEIMFISGAQMILSGTDGDLLVYDGTPTLGNLIGSWSPDGGTDAYGNTYPIGLSVNLGSITGTTCSLTSLTVTDGPAIFYTDTVSSYTSFRSSGTYTPTLSGDVMVLAIGPGGNGYGGATTPGGGGGGGSVVASDTVVASTPYTITVPGPGSPTTATFASGTQIVARQGGNGSSTAGGNPGALGSGPAGYVSYEGGTGQAGTSFYTGAGGGGAGAGQGGGTPFNLEGGLGAPAYGLFPAAGNGGGGKTVTGAGYNGFQPGGGGGGGSTTGGSGAKGLVFIIFTAATSSQEPYASLSGVSTVDPVSGYTVPVGLGLYDSSGNTAALTGTSGNLIVGNSLDGNNYDACVKHVVVYPVQTVSSTTGVNITGASVGVGTSHYRWTCIIWLATSASGGNPSFSFTSPGTTGNVSLTATYTYTAAAGNAISRATNTSTTLGQGLTLSGAAGQLVVMSGDATFSASGTLQLTAETTSSSDTFTVETVYLDLYPVN